MFTECVLCDWQMSWTAPSRGVYLPGYPVPVAWTGEQPESVRMSDTVASSIASVALVAHWGEAHPEQLRLLIGEFETDSYPRSRPPGP